MSPSLISFSSRKLFTGLAIVSAIFLAVGSFGSAIDDHEQYQKEWVYTEHSDAVRGVAIDQDGNVFSASQDDEVHKIDENSEQVWTYTEHSDTFRDVAIGQDGNVFASTSDGEVHKIDENGEQVWTYTDHTGNVYSVVVDEDGNIYSGDGSEEVHKIDQDGNQVWTYNEHSGHVHGISVDQDGNVFSASTDDEVHKIDENGEQVWTYTDHTDYVGAISVDHNGNVYSGDGAGEIHKIDGNGNQVWTYSEHSNNLESISVDQNGNVYSASTDEEVHKIDHNGNQIWSYTDHSSSAISVGVGQNGNVYSGNLDNELHKIGYIPEVNEGEVEESDYNLTAEDYAIDLMAESMVPGSHGIVGSQMADISAGVLQGVYDFVFGTTDVDPEVYHDDIRSNAVIKEEDRESRIQDSYDVADLSYGHAQADAKRQAVEYLNDGVDQEQAVQNVTEDVDDYYTDIERSIVATWNSEIMDVQDDKVTAEDIEGAEITTPLEGVDDVTISEHERELINGETMNVYRLIDEENNRVIAEIDENINPVMTDGENEIDEAEYINGQPYGEILSDVIDRRQDALSGVNQIVDGIYDEYEADEIEPVDLTDPLEELHQYSESFDDTGSLDYAYLTLEQMGQPVHDLETSAKVEVDGEEYEGALTADYDVIGADGVITAGETYDGSDGHASIVYQPDDPEESAERLFIDEEFEVTELTEITTGEEINETEIEEQEYYTEEIEDLEEQLKEIEEQQDEYLGGIGDGFIPDIGFDAQTIAIIVALLIGLMALS